jgi:hypothetical protein
LLVLELAIAPKQESAGGQASKEPKRLSELHEKDCVRSFSEWSRQTTETRLLQTEAKSEQRESGHHGPGK